MKKNTETEAHLEFQDNHAASLLFGQNNEHLKTISRELGVRLHARGNVLRIRGDDPDVVLAKDLFGQLYGMIEKGHPIYGVDINYAARILSQDRTVRLEKIFLDTIFISARKKVITPKSPTQKVYIDSIRTNDIVVGIGPAGTGKTYLAMAMAVAYLLKKEVQRIILVRPAVEAGEKLGFLPGDLYEKVNPYLRPLYDALHDMMDFDKASSMIQRGEIEVAPLAFMRGRTLNDSFVILDEAQNTTSEQMKMFLTRLGFNSKAVVTGDVTQIDLPVDARSGLIEIANILSGIKGICFVYFSERDVVRHPLVQEVIKAYDRADRAQREKATDHSSRSEDQGHGGMTQEN